MENEPRGFPNRHFLDRMVPRAQRFGSDTRGGSGEAWEYGQGSRLGSRGLTLVDEADGFEEDVAVDG